MERRNCGNCQFYGRDKPGHCDRPFNHQELFGLGGNRFRHPSPLDSCLNHRPHETAREKLLREAGRDIPLMRENIASGYMSPESQAVIDKYQRQLGASKGN